MRVIPRSLVGLLAIIPLALHAFPASGTEARKPCDLDGSGRCDLGDRYLFQLVSGACVGDRTYFLAAEVDRDGCITAADENLLFGLAYSTVDPTTHASLRETLHEVIDDHTRIPYTASSTDTWDVLELADQDPGSSSSILDIYKNATYAKFGAGTISTIVSTPGQTRTVFPTTAPAIIPTRIATRCFCPTPATTVPGETTRTGPVWAPAPRSRPI